MKLTIIAATGGIGRCLLEQSVAACHDVTAVARDPGRLALPVRAVAADLTSAAAADLVPVMAGADAVLSALGPRSTAEVGVTTRGTDTIAKAMATAGVRRLIVVSAAPLSSVPSPGQPRPPRRDPGEGFFMRHLLTPMVKALLRKHYADLAAMEDLVTASGLDWTIVRPPRLTEGPLTRNYRTAYGRNLRRGLRISRADTAHCMLELLARPDAIRQAVGVAY